ncbi:MAG: RidA family protein [Cellvibrionaceae bacterium]
MFVLENLKKLNLSLPEASPVAGNYSGYILHNKILYVSGQTAKESGELIYSGKVGLDLSLAEGVSAAQVCALNLLAQVNKACEGDWDKLEKCLKLSIFVNSSPDFIDHPKVANGASDLIVSALGERGIHSRAAVGVNSLPGNSAVEVEGVFVLKN